ncbi:MAG: ethylbenzene dehydrogenase-related protein [Acidobacteriota bacterium]
MEWDDPTIDNLPGAARFSDACAVQMPEEAAADLPAPQMGEAGRRVAITYWRASWQSEAEGRGDTIRDLYPNASVDHYPFEAPPLGKNPAAQREETLRYAPAKALGNAMEGRSLPPVQDLLAEGPGSLTPAPVQGSRGQGIRTKTGWAVVLVRKLPGGTVAGSRKQVAFAVWQGSEQEVGSRKMRTGWISLSLEKGL